MKFRRQIIVSVLTLTFCWHMKLFQCIRMNGSFSPVLFLKEYLWVCVQIVNSRIDTNRHTLKRTNIEARNQQGTSERLSIRPCALVTAYSGICCTCTFAVPAYFCMFLVFTAMGYWVANVDGLLFFWQHVCILFDTDCMFSCWQINFLHVLHVTFVSRRNIIKQVARRQCYEVFVHVLR